MLTTDAEEALWSQTARATEFTEDGVFVVLGEFSTQRDVGFELQRVVRSLASIQGEDGTHLALFDVLNLRRDVHAHFLV